MVFLRLGKAIHLSDYAYAHRGLWNVEGPPENSLRAIQDAQLADLGIEFDIRPSADGTPFVFHDPTLDRMTLSNGRFEDYSDSEVARVTLIDGSPIPRLVDVLKVWSSPAPLFCELKIDGRTNPNTFSRRVLSDLEGFTGAVVCISFSEAAVAACRGFVPVGQTLERCELIGHAAFKAKLERALTVGVDCIAIHHEDIEHVVHLRKAAHIPIAVWTIASGAQSQALKRYQVAQIFEGFDPEVAKP